MPILKAQVVLPHVSGLPRDSVVNTFHFLTIGDFDNAADHAAVVNKVVDFYQGISLGQDRSVGEMLSATISRGVNAAKVKIYRVLPGPDGPPVFEGPFTVPAANTQNGLPSEVAVCGSYYAGKNQKRRRGRIYIGPLNLGALDATAARPHPNPNVLTAVRLSMGRLIPQGPDLQKWAVYSKADGVARAVTGGWVDDAFDTQRRRGERAVSRTFVGAPPE